MSYIDKVYEQVLARNPGEKEFHQAVKEVLDSLEPVVEKHPEFKKAKILADLKPAQPEPAKQCPDKDPPQ